MMGTQLGDSSAWRVSDHDDKSITFRGESSGPAVEQVISKNNVIGLLVPKNQGEEFVLLYVEEKDDEGQQEGSTQPEENGEQATKTAPETRTYFRQLNISNPPTALVEECKARDLSWLPTAAGSKDTQQERKLVVLVSSNSGMRAADSAYKNLLEPFLNRISAQTNSPDPQSQQKTTHEVIRTTSASSISEYAKTTLHPRANAGTHQTLILLSGDGGIVETVNALLATDTPTASTYSKPVIAIMPLGTGNALANSSGIAHDATIGLSTLLRGTPRPLPLLRITLPGDTIRLDAYGEPAADDDETPQTRRVLHAAVVFSWCLHASLVADSDTEAYRAHGAKRFWMAGMENLFPPDGSSAHVYRGRIEVRREGGDAGGWVALGGSAGSHAYFLVTLVACLERGFCISPASSPLDGVMRVVHLPEMEEGGAGVARVLTKVAEGAAHVDDPDVAYEAVEGVRVWIDEAERRWRRVCVDGTIYVAGGRGTEDGCIEVAREQREVVDLVVL